MSASPTPTPPQRQQQIDFRKPNTVDWSRFACSQYITKGNDLCNSDFELLHRLGSRADCVMYPSHMFNPDEAEIGTSQSAEAQLLIKVRNEYETHRSARRSAEPSRQRVCSVLFLR
jgi:hypothetical protein